MSGLLHDLLGIVKVAVISGGGWPQFEKQLVSNLPHDKLLANLSPSYLRHKVLPIRVSRLEKDLFGRFHYRSKRKDPRFPKEGDRSCRLQIEKLWGEQIEDRGSQITFSALGQKAPLEEKEKWDPDFAKRKKIKAIVDNFIPSFLSESGARHLSTLPSPGLTRPTASENCETCSVFR